jgi:aspartate aminotransferase-like enzyme
LSSHEPRQTFARCQPRLRAIFGTAEPVALLPAAGDIGLELVLRSAILHRAAVLVHGERGERLARVAESLDREVVRIVTAPDLPVDPSQVDRFLDGPAVDALLVELGMDTDQPPFPLDAIGRMVHRRRGILLVAEASATIGIAPMEMDRWGLDCVLASSEGALGLPGGMSLVAASGRLLQRSGELAGRGTLLDLKTHYAAAKEGRVGAPVAPALLQALEQRLGGLVSSPRP